MRTQFQPRHAMGFVARILMLALGLLSGHASADLPPYIQTVPVSEAQCIALHPAKPVLYVGRSFKQLDGKNLAVLSLNENGGIDVASRRNISDGLVESPAPIPPDLAYSVSSIAVNPVESQLYVASNARKPRVFRAETNTVLVAALALDQNGMPLEKVAEYAPKGRYAAIYDLECDPLGRLVYFGEIVGPLGFWSLRNQESVRVTAAPKSRRDLSPLTAKRWLAMNEGLVLPRISITKWTYVPEWKRCYGCERGTAKVIFQLGDDGRSLAFAQKIPTQSIHSLVPQVSVKYRKMYVANAQGTKLGLYQLTREGHLTSVPRFISFEPSTLMRLDDQRSQLYVAQPKGMLAVYSLDEDGVPKADPQRFDLKSGGISDMALSTQGYLYVACTTPPGGKP